MSIHLSLGAYNLESAGQEPIVGGFTVNNEEKNLDLSVYQLIARIWRAYVKYCPAFSKAVHNLPDRAPDTTPVCYVCVSNKM